MKKIEYGEWSSHPEIVEILKVPKFETPIRKKVILKKDRVDTGVFKM